MAYKKYIKRGGKVYGPYIYHSRKVNGKVISEYLGKDENKKGKNKTLSLLIIALITAFLLFATLNYNKVDFEEGIKITKTIFNSIGSSLTRSLTGLMISEDVNESEKVQPETSEDIDEDISTGGSQEGEIKERPANETTSQPQNISEEEPINETLNQTFVEENETEQTTQNYSIETNFTEQNITINETNETIPTTEITENITNATIPEFNITETNATNITIENITQENITIQTIQYQAVLGQPVKWKKQIIPESIGKIKIPLPQEAENISVNKIKENITSVSKITGGVISENIKESALIKFLKNILGALTGKVTDDSEEMENEQESEIEIEVDDIDAEYEIEYFTDAPYAVEETLETGKRVKIIGPENLHYENVLSFTDLPEEVAESNIKLYRTTEGVKELTTITNYIDENNNGLIEKIEWIVPQLSNQTYEIIIEITKAEHLDENRTFISDIYEEVRALDDVWSEEISDTHYVRITFERNLTSENDITLYPRVVSGNPKIEVYGVDGNEIIATFDSLNSNEYNKVYLTDLQGEQDTFDLRVLDGSVEFDYIIDPTSLDFEDWESYSDGDVTIAGSAWTNTAGDDCDWQVDSGGTPSSNTGPSIDHTLGTSAGKYFYMEVSSGWCQTPNPGSTSIFNSTEMYDADTYNFNITFWYHMYGSTIGTLYFEVYNGTWNEEWSLTGAQGDTWYFGFADLTDKYSGSIAFRFRGVQAGQYYSDFALDDINVTGTLKSAEDNEYPQFSNYWDDNATLVGSGTGNFNVTVTSTNGTVLLEIDGVNVTATNLTAELYNASYYFTSNGTYPYRWHSWGNGTSANYNVSAEQYYVVNVTPKINLDVLYPLNLSEIFYATQNQFFNITVNVSCSVSNCGEINISLDPFPDYEYDMYEDFEDALGASWTITDTDNNINEQDPDAKYSGSQGVSVNMTGSTPGGEVALIGYNMGANRPNVSVGFWFYFPQFPSAGPEFFSQSSTASSMGTYNGKLYYYNSPDRVRTRGTAFGSDIEFTPSNWYWLTMQIIKNGTTTTRIYDTNHNQVGSDDTVTGRDFDLGYLTWGVGAANDNNEIIFFDDLVVDWTDWTFPLLGWETGKGGLISTTEGATPFYTNATNNPLNISLNQNESQIITFWVNATGTIDKNYTFFIYANKTSNLTISNRSDDWNVTIVSQEETTPPDVTINFPQNTTYYSLLDLPFIFNVSLNENGSVEYTLDGGITNVTMNTTDNQNFNATLETLDDGEYTFQVYANDTAGNRNDTESVVFTLTTENVIVNGTVKDSLGDTINSTVVILYSENSTVLYNETEEIHDETTIPIIELYDIEVVPLEINSISVIEFTEVNLSGFAGDSINLVQVDEIIDDPDFEVIHVVNPVINDFANATMTFLPGAKRLYKCQDWNFTERTCDGDWELLSNKVNTTQENTVELEPNATAYGEIPITNALHLDSDREFISNIFEQVIYLDGNWSETIPSGDYVRVTFLVNLTSANDITLYPRTVSGTPSIEVYENNESTLIANFTSINDNEYNKVFLTSLDGTQNMFDLHIVGGSVEFDHIIDPTFYIRSGTTSTDTAGVGTATFGSSLSNTNYAALITGGSDDDTPFAKEWNSKTTSSFGIKIEDDGGANEPVNPVYWLAVPYGEYDFGNNVYIKCGAVTGSFSSGTITFDTAFPDVNYAFICNPTTNADSPNCLYDDAQKTASSIAFKVENDADASVTVSAIDWCAFTSGEYTIDDVKFKAGIADISNWNGFTVSFGTNFDDTNYIVMATHGDSDTTDPSSCEIGNLQVGSFDAKCEDDGGAAGGTGEYMDWFAVQSGSFDLTYDPEYPKFSDYWDDNATLVGSGTGLFNVTVISTNGTVLLEIDGNNITATNLTADVYNASYYFSSAGTYTYRWHSWGNGTNANYNKSIDRSYTVNEPDTPPTWSNPSVNDSTPLPGATVRHNIYWTDDNTMSYAALEVNSSGVNCDTTANVSSTTISGASSWANLTWQVPNACEGKTISWVQYANDSINQWNVTSLQTYAVNNIPPQIQFVAPTEANETSKNRQWIFANITIVEDNFKNVTFKLFNSTGLVNGTTYTDNTRSINWTNLDNNNVLYWYNVSVYDQANNFNQTETRYITLISNIAPEVTILYPQNTTYNVDVTQLNYSAIDANENLESCWYSLNGGITNSSPDETCSNFTGLTSNQGSNTWTVYANDSAGLEGSDSVTFTKDTVAPSVTINSPLNQNYTTTTITFNVTATDTTTSVNSCWYSLNNGLTNTTLQNAAGNYWNHTNSSMTQGSHTAKFYCNDSAGNLNNTQTVTFFIDSIVPLIEYTTGTPSNNSNLSQNFIFINVSVSETNFKNITYRLYNSTSQVNITTYTTPVTIINWTNLPDETYKFNVTVFDIAGNSNSTPTRTVNLDTIYPQFSNYLRAPTTPNEDQNVQVNVTITETNLDKVILEFNNGTAKNYTVTTNNGNEYYFTILQGNYTAHASVIYYWYANDTVGNMNKSSQQSFTVANQPPTVSSPAINDTTPETNDLISCNGGTFSDNDAGDTEQVRYFKWYDTNVEISGQTSQTLSLTVAGLDKGDVIKCSIRVYDGYDNSSWTNSSNTATIQNSPPTITNTQTTVSWNANGSTFNYDYEATDADNDGFTWYDNTTLFDINSATGIISDTPTESEAGIYEIRISVSDGSVNATDDFTYTINDVTPPNINFISPTEENNSQLTRNYIQVNVTASDGKAIGTITLRLYNSTSLVQTNTSLTSPLFVNFTNLPDEFYYFNATVNDTSGNTNQTGTRKVTTDTGAPTINYVSPTENSGVYRSRNYIAVNVTASDPNLDKIIIRLYNSARAQINSASSSTSPNLANFTGLNDGLYYYNATANDTFGNENSLATRNITLDITKPSITNLVESPTDPATYSQGQIYRFNATITDTNLDKVLIEFNGINYTPTKTGNVYNLTKSDLAAGIYNYYWYANDSAGNINQTSAQTYTVNQDTGACNVLFNETSPVNYGTLFNVFSDCSSDFTLKRNGTGISNNSVQNLAAGTWNFTVQRADTQNYSNIYDEELFTTNKAAGNVTLLINGSAQNQAGIYGIQTNASASTLYGTLTLYRNGTDVTPENNNYVTLAVNYYNYTAVSSGDQNHSSALTTLFVNISKAQSEVNLTLNGTRGNITIVQDSTIPINLTTITGDSGATLRLYKNGTLINQGVSPLSNSSAFNFVGLFNITGFYIDSQNYTKSFETWWVNVTEAPDLTNPSVSGLTESPADPATYSPGQIYRFNATITDNRDVHTISIEFNGVNYTPINLGEDIYSFNRTDLAVGIYNYRWYANDTSGNMNGTESGTYTINKAAPSLSLTITPSNTVTYPTQTTANGSNCPSQLTCNLYRDSVSVNNPETATLAIGTYNYTYNTTGNANYTSASVSQNLTFNQNTGACDVLFNETSPITYPAAFKVWTNCNSAFTLYRNGTSITNNSVQSLAASSYNFTVIRADIQNYSNYYDEEQFIIQKAIGVVYTYINNSRANKTIEQYTEIYINGTLVNGTGNIKLYNNGTLINQGTSPLSNFTNFTTIWLYNITTIYDGNENYTSAYETWWLNVSEADVTPPQISITHPENTTYNSIQTQLNYTATDNFELNSCWYSLNNGVTNTTITCNENITGLNSGQGNSTWTVWANDAKGNLNSSSVTFFVDSINPTISFVPPTETNNTSLGRNYIQINVTASDTNPDTITIRLYNSTNLLRENTSKTSQFFINYTGLTAGTYFFNATVNDSVNNQNSTQTRNISLVIPTLTIIKPKNETYITNESLPLSYSVSYQDYVWYNLDQTGGNKTISGDTTFNVSSEGSHTLYLYANNSNGETAENITFTINLSKFIIYYDKYKDPEKGESTNFNQHSYNEIQNLSGVILENTDYGRIEFNEPINLTDDSNFDDNEVDLDSYTNISLNHTEINSTALPNFNKSATLYLYNLTFSNPRILRNNETCPSTICTKISYSGGGLKTLIFNVTQFTVYSAEETPVEEMPVKPSEERVSKAPIAECLNNTDCESGEVCWNYRCVKLFDIKITNFESPVELGGFFTFTYLIKGMARINDDVEVRFWIENQAGERVTSGSDTIYLGSFEEKIETTKIFLPTNIKSGVYEFYIQVVHQAYQAKSHRTIEITVKEGIATIRFREVQELKIYASVIIALLSIIIIFLIIQSLRKKQPLVQEKIIKEVPREIPKEKEELELYVKPKVMGYAQKKEGIKKTLRKISGIFRNLIGILSLKISNLYQTLKKRREELRLQRHKQIYQKKPRKILVEKEFYINNLLLKIKVVFLRVIYGIKLAFIRLWGILKKRKEKIEGKNKQYSKKKEKKTAEKLIREISKNAERKKELEKDIISDIVEKEKREGKLD